MLAVGKSDLLKPLSRNANIYRMTDNPQFAEPESIAMRFRLSRPSRNRFSALAFLINSSPAPPQEALISTNFPAKSQKENSLGFETAETLHAQ
jgi:hypothetical protein